jgi:hypothetical protein
MHDADRARATETAAAEVQCSREGPASDESRRLADRGELSVSPQAFSANVQAVRLGLASAHGCSGLWWVEVAIARLLTSGGRAQAWTPWPFPSMYSEPSAEVFSGLQKVCKAIVNGACRHGRPFLSLAAQPPPGPAHAWSRGPRQLKGR